MLYLICSFSSRQRGTSQPSRRHDSACNFSKLNRRLQSGHPLRTPLSHDAPCLRKSCEPQPNTSVVAHAAKQSHKTHTHTHLHLLTVWRATGRIAARCCMLQQLQMQFDLSASLALIHTRDSALTSSDWDRAQRMRMWLQRQLLRVARMAEILVPTGLAMVAHTSQDLCVTLVAVHHELRSVWVVEVVQDHH